MYSAESTRNISTADRKKKKKIIDRYRPHCWLVITL